MKPINYETLNTRALGGLELLMGTAAIAATMTIGKEAEEPAKIIGYVLGGGMIADGGADLISGRTASLLFGLYNAGHYIGYNISRKIRKLKSKQENKK